MRRVRSSRSSGEQRRRVDIAAGGNYAQQPDRIFSGMFDGQLTASRFDLELIDYLVSNLASKRGASIGVLDEWNGHFVRFFENHSDALRDDCEPASAAR